MLYSSPHGPSKVGILSWRGRVRRLTLVSFAICFALGLASQVETQAKPQIEANSVREPNRILGAPIYSRAKAERYARSAGCTRYILKAIPIYYRLAPLRNIRPDVLVAQAVLGTSRGHYGGDSRPWNMAGIKKGGAVRDRPKDFEVPQNAREGVRMHVNHMAAYTGKRAIGKPHDRYYEARAAQRRRGWWVRKVSQLGNSVWATDPEYGDKIRRILHAMAKR
jgi:flagellum-specific peptidoglycan hydrolase FlgJ